MPHAVMGRLREGRYRLLARIRVGGSGEVWRALDTQAGQEVAIKAIPGAAGGWEAAAREVEAQQAVAHPGCIRVIEAFEDDDHGYIVMALAACNLADYVSSRGPLDPSAARGVITTLAEVLAAAHAAGVVHRDVKPQNVLVMPDGSVRLADFGIARLHARGHTRTGALLGTLPYMAPEQRANARAVSAGTDVYALGMLLAWMRTGVTPGDLYVKDVLDSLAVRLRQAGEVDDQLCDAIADAGAYDPGARPADAGAWLNRWRATLGGSAGGLRPPTSPLDDTLPPPPVPNPAPRPRASPSGWERAQTWAAPSLSALAATSALGITAFNLWRSAPAPVAPPPPTPTVAAQEPCSEAEYLFSDYRRLGPEEAITADAADLDRDGQFDLLYIHQQAEVARVYWGGTAQSLVDPTDLPVGRTATDVAVGDVNEDGHLDLIAALTDDNAFSLLLGRGDRRFRDRTSFFQGPSPTWPALIDLDRDGHLDLLFVEGKDRVAARQGRGDGTFAPHKTIWRGGPGAPVGLVGAWQVGDETRLRVSVGTTLRDLAVSFHDAARTLETIAPPEPWTQWAPAPGADAPPPLIAVTLDARVLQRRDDGSWCRLGTGIHPRAWDTFRAYDLNRDGVPEILSTSTCAGCTSNHVIWQANVP